MIYDFLAPIYDRVNGEVDYSVWADFIEENARRHMDEPPHLALDLCCGTGRMTLELARRGYDMTGVDLSPEMLGVARENAENEGLDILWLCQDMREFELYGTVELCTCLLDSVNHLTERRDLMDCFSLVHNYLSPNGLFIFDINGRGKFERVYADNAFVVEDGGDMCVWQNYYNAKSKFCDFYITLFKECEGGAYERIDEVQRERVYTIRQIKSALSDSGFEVLGAYSDFNFTEANDCDERIHFVARCKK
ncbi:MAG: class I SAM-dependent methyltransferase [Clostridia bacterium]|nr:class I SAM-dependent methyltransferase [Clostridia bacterium]